MKTSVRFLLVLVSCAATLLSWVQPVFAWGEGPCGWGGTGEAVVSANLWTDWLIAGVPLLLAAGLVLTGWWTSGKRRRLLLAGQPVS